MVKHFMRRHSLADPMYAGLPDMPPHARPSMRLVGKAIEPDASGNLPQIPAPAVRACESPNACPKESPHEKTPACCLSSCPCSGLRYSAPPCK